MPGRRASATSGSEVPDDARPRGRREQHPARLTDPCPSRPSSGDRALPCGGRGRTFESCRAHCLLSARSGSAVLGPRCLALRLTEADVDRLLAARRRASRPSRTRSSGCRRRTSRTSRRYRVRRSRRACLARHVGGRQGARGSRLRRRPDSAGSETGIRRSCVRPSSSTRRAARGDRGGPARAAAHRARRAASRRSTSREPGARTLGVIGCGWQAETQVACIREALPGIEEIVAYCRTEERLQAFCKEVGAEPGESHRDAGRGGRRRHDHHLARPGAARRVAAAGRARLRRRREPSRARASSTTPSSSAPRSSAATRSTTRSSSRAT